MIILRVLGFFSTLCLVVACKDKTHAGASKTDRQPATRYGWTCKEESKPDRDESAAATATSGESQNDDASGSGSDSTAKSAAAAESAAVEARADAAGGASPDSILISTCAYKQFVLLDTGWTDRTGKTSWKGAAYAREADGTLRAIANHEMFNSRLPILAKRIEDSVWAQVALDLDAPESENCFSDEQKEALTAELGRRAQADSLRTKGKAVDTSKGYVIDGYRLSILENDEMFFSMDEGSHIDYCAPVWEAIGSVRLDTLANYLK